jgi:beta-fructofuranosidase
MTFVVSTRGKQLLRVTYLPERHAFLVAGEMIALEPSDEPNLHAFIDASVVELIVSQRVGYTKRFYLEGGAAAPDLTVSASGAGVSAEGWRVTPISKNRLATTALKG